MKWTLRSSNGNYATDAGIKLTDALFQEPSFAYVNWSAIKSADVGKSGVEDDKRL